jgi:hypothetical protein
MLIFLPGLAWNRDPPISAPQVAVITDIGHQASLVSLFLRYP